ncbi:hypothetical protein GC173_17755 [bacterium]|nr:hypothetical protein [bacterium]
MASPFTVAGKFALALILGVTLVAGCSSAPRPVVQDFDTFQVVNIGQLRYTTPDGYHVVRQKAGYAIHEAGQLPGSTIMVKYDVNPPRNLNFDADAEKRQFLDQVPGARLTSAQYSEEGARKRIKIMVEGLTREKEQLRGALLMVREGNRTATVRIIGPWEDRNEINHQIEKLAASFEFGDKYAPKAVAKK